MDLLTELMGQMGTAMASLARNTQNVPAQMDSITGELHYLRAQVQRYEHLTAEMTRVGARQDATDARVAELNEQRSIADRRIAFLESALRSLSREQESQPAATGSLQGSSIAPQQQPSPLLMSFRQLSTTSVGHGNSPQHLSPVPSHSPASDVPGPADDPPLSNTSQSSPRITEAGRAGENEGKERM